MKTKIHSKEIKGKAMGKAMTTKTTEFTAGDRVTITNKFYNTGKGAVVVGRYTAPPPWNGWVLLIDGADDLECMIDGVAAAVGYKSGDFVRASR